MFIHLKIIMLKDCSQRIYKVAINFLIKPTSFTENAVFLFYGNDKLWFLYQHCFQFISNLYGTNSCRGSGKNEVASF